MKNFGVGTLLHATVFRVAKNVKQADLKNIFLNQVKCMLAPFVTLGFSIKKKTTESYTEFIDRIG